MPEPIESILERHEPSLMAIPGVVGVGIGGSAEDPVIVVMVDRLTPDLRQALPRSLDGFRVTVEVAGDITAF